MIVSFSSTTLKRVCRATPQAEIYALQNAQEAGDRVRALLAELYGYGTTGPDWHDTSRRAIHHVMRSDCRSLVANLNTKVLSRVQDKTLQIESSTPYTNRYSMAAYGRGLPQERKPGRLGSDSDADTIASQRACSPRACSEFWIHAGTRSRAKGILNPAHIVRPLHL